MLSTSIQDYKAGWMFGNFSPAVLKTTDFEMAHHTYEKGCIGRNHKHEIATEYNYVVNGEVNVNGKVFRRGDMFIFTPGEYCGDVTYNETTDLIIIKTPSCVGDKYNEKNQAMAMPR